MANGTALASEVDGVVLKEIHTNRYGGGAYLVLANARSGDPCPVPNAYYISFSDSAGNQMYSEALAAFAGNFKLNIIGTGTCGGPANAELINDLQMTH